MVELTDLWLPILIASVSVFIVSAVLWMALPHHKADIRAVPPASPLPGAIASSGLAPGFYMFPHSEDCKNMKSPEFREKWEAGPWGTINILPHAPRFGMNLLKTFLAFLVISALVGYLTGLALAPGEDFASVFHVAAITAVLGHCMGGLAHAFFMGKPTRFIVTDFIDGVVYALVTAAVFALMWPGAPVLVG